MLLPLPSDLGVGSRIRHPEYGIGVIINLMPDQYRVVFIEEGLVDLPRKFGGFEVIETLNPPDKSVQLKDVEDILLKILRKWGEPSEIVLMGKKWTGGKFILQPGTTGLASKEIPIDQFFHKIVMLRDRLRIIEQKVNASSGLNDEEKVAIQQYITRCYGSLTSFNLLFQDTTDYFIGDKIKYD